MIATPALNSITGTMYLRQRQFPSHLSHLPLTRKKPETSCHWDGKGGQAVPSASHLPQHSALRKWAPLLSSFREGSQWPKNRKQEKSRDMIVFSLVLILFCLVVHYPRLYLCPWIPRYQKPKALPERSFHDMLRFLQKSSTGKHNVYTPLYPSPSLRQCPPILEDGYPKEFPILDVLRHWPTNDTTNIMQRTIHQGICELDFATMDHSTVHTLIRRYQDAEVPFVVRNDPAAIQTAFRWNSRSQDHERNYEHSNSYLHWLLQGRVFRAEFSTTPTMMYWNRQWQHKAETLDQKAFREPTAIRPLSYAQWYTMTSSMHSSDETSVSPPQREYAYLRADACLPQHAQNCTAMHRYPIGVCPHGLGYYAQLSHANELYNELPMFNPYHASSRPYQIDPHLQNGIQCRFGSAGITAVSHFDNMRNWIAMLQGQRRYILSHPRNCDSLQLYPIDHPLERHSQVDWNDPNIEQFPEFQHARANEVVLQAGDLLYLPTYWFHHIVSLDTNVQCNTRSGYSLEYDGEIDRCGFLYPLAS